MVGKGKKGLYVEIPEELYNRAKEDAQDNNWTITIYVTQALMDMINKSKSYKS